MGKGPFGGPRPFQNSQFRVLLVYENSFSDNNRNKLDREGFSGSYFENLWTNGMYYLGWFNGLTVTSWDDTGIVEPSESGKEYKLIEFGVNLKNKHDYVGEDQINKVGRKIASEYGNKYDTFMIGGV